MTARIRIAAGGWDELSSHLLREDGKEHVAFLPTVFREVENELELLAGAPILIPDSDLVGGPAKDYLELKLEALLRVVNEAVGKGVGLVEVHNHPGAEAPARFSPADHAGFRRVVPYMLRSLPVGFYGALVLGGPDNVDGVVWSAKEERPIPLETVEAVGRNRVVLRTTSAPPVEGRSVGEDALEHFDRQVRAFGADGQAKLNALRVGIVGVGGLGSIVVEQLIRSGVGSVVLVDPDRVEESNLSRVALTRPEDVGRLKVEVMRERILSLDPGARVQAIPSSVCAEEALRALSKVDVLLGCTDNSSSRFALNEIALRFLRPYLDLGSEIHTADGKLSSCGGRFTFTLPGAGCLLCAMAIDPCDAASEFRPQEAREADIRAGYIQGSEEPAPAVMSLNGVVASLGVFELQAWATGIRQVESQSFFDAASGEVRRVATAANKTCLACAEHLGRGGLEELISRYVAFTVSRP